MKKCKILEQSISDSGKAGEDIFAVKIVKSMDRSIRDMCQNEYNILKNLNHPNIVSVHDIYESHLSTHMVMDVAQGVLLADMFK